MFRNMVIFAKDLRIININDYSTYLKLIVAIFMKAAADDIHI